MLLSLIHIFAQQLRLAQALHGHVQRQALAGGQFGQAGQHGLHRGLAGGVGMARTGFRAFGRPLLRGGWSLHDSFNFGHGFNRLRRRGLARSRLARGLRRHGLGGSRLLRRGRLLGGCRLDGGLGSSLARRGLAGRLGLGVGRALAMFQHGEIVVDALRLVARLAALPDAPHDAALLAQAMHQRRKVGIRRRNHHHVGPLGQHQVDGVHRQRDVGAVLAGCQVDHRLDAQVLEPRLVLDRAFGGAVGTPHVQSAMLLEQQAHGLVHHVHRHVVGVDAVSYTHLSSDSGMVHPLQRP